MGMRNDLIPLLRQGAVPHLGEWPLEPYGLCFTDLTSG